MTQRGSQHTTMTSEIHIALCQYKRDNHEVTQKELRAWLLEKHITKVAQSTISATLKRSAQVLKMADNFNLSQKRQGKVKYPEMEEALAEWFDANQDCVNMCGDLLKESAKKILDRLLLTMPLLNFPMAGLIPSRPVMGSVRITALEKRICQYGAC